jgi:hypothetical protein
MSNRLEDDRDHAAILAWLGPEKAALAESHPDHWGRGAVEVRDLRVRITGWRVEGRSDEWITTVLIDHYRLGLIEESRFDPDHAQFFDDYRRLINHLLNEPIP